MPPWKEHATLELQLPAETHADAVKEFVAGVQLGLPTRFANDLV